MHCRTPRWADTRNLPTSSARDVMQLTSSSPGGCGGECVTSHGRRSVMTSSRRGVDDGWWWRSSQPSTLCQTNWRNCESGNWRRQLPHVSKSTPICSPSSARTHAHIHTWLRQLSSVRLAVEVLDTFAAHAFKIQLQGLCYSSNQQQLHWLPVKWRIQYKLAYLTYKVLHTGIYLSERLHPYVPSRTLRSSSSVNLYDPSTNLPFGSCSFYIAAPTVWNSLPSTLRSSQTLNTFRKHLKTNIFQSAFNSP